MKKKNKKKIILIIIIAVVILTAAVLINVFIKRDHAISTQSAMKEPALREYDQYLKFSELFLAGGKGYEFKNHISNKLIIY